MTEVAMPVLALDFDGVISNSIHDSLRTSLNTYIQLYPDHMLPVDDIIHPGNLIFDFEKIHPGLFSDYQNLIPLGNRAEDYYTILYAIDKGLAGTIQNQADYNRLQSQLPADRMRLFSQTFYRLRQQYQAADPEGWSDLLPVFPGVADAVKCLSRRFRLAIATSKDRASIDIQLKHYGLSDYFKSGSILDKDFSESKRQHMKRLHAEFQVDYHQIHLVDDKLIHLDAVAPLGVHPYLALWGFNTQREHNQAAERGYGLLKLNELIHIGAHVK